MGKSQGWRAEHTGIGGHEGNINGVNGEVGEGGSERKVRHIAEGASNNGSYGRREMRGEERGRVGGGGGGGDYASSDH